MKKEITYIRHLLANILPIYLIRGVYCPCYKPTLITRVMLHQTLPARQSLASTLLWPCYLDLRTCIDTSAFVNLYWAIIHCIHAMLQHRLRKTKQWFFFPGTSQSILIINMHEINRTSKLCDFILASSKSLYSLGKHREYRHNFNSFDKAIIKSHNINILFLSHK